MEPKGWFGLKGWAAGFWNFTAMGVICGLMLWAMNRNDRLTAAQLQYLQTELTTVTVKAENERNKFWERNRQQQDQHVQAIDKLSERIDKALSKMP